MTLPDLVASLDGHGSIAELAADLASGCGPESSGPPSREGDAAPEVEAPTCSCCCDADCRCGVTL